MTLGFTGTSQPGGMTQRQRAAVRYLLGELQCTVFHHGVCVGADAQAHNEAVALGIRVVGHPPSLTRKMALLALTFHTYHRPYGYLTRNLHIVRGGVDGLIAAPRQMKEPSSTRGEGTWTTVGYARKAGRRIWIVWPDGTFTEEATR